MDKFLARPDVVDLIDRAGTIQGLEWSAKLEIDDSLERRATGAVRSAAAQILSQATGLPHSLLGNLTLTIAEGGYFRTGKRGRVVNVTYPATVRGEDLLHPAFREGWARFPSMPCLSSLQIEPVNPEGFYEVALIENQMPPPERKIWLRLKEMFDRYTGVSRESAGITTYTWA